MCIDKSPQTMLHVNLLGILEIYLDAPPNLDFRTRKAQALLIYLTVTSSPDSIGLPQEQMVR